MKKYVFDYLDKYAKAEHCKPSKCYVDNYQPLGLNSKLDYELGSPGLVILCCYSYDHCYIQRKM